MSDDVRLLCGCWNVCDLSCVRDEEDTSLIEEDDDYWDPRDDYDQEDIPGSRFDPECEDNPM